MQLRQQPPGLRYSTTTYFVHTAAPFTLPTALFLVNGLIKWLLMFIEKREDKHIKKLEDAKKKLIKELKVHVTGVLCACMTPRHALTWAMRADV